MNLYSYGSSSAGNNYLIEFKSFNIVIDIGVSAFSKVKDKNYLKWNKVKYLLISHEHSDHTRYLKSYMQYNSRMKVIINPRCYEELLKKTNGQYFMINKKRFILLDYNKVLKSSSKNIWFYTFRVFHNSVANNGYVIKIDGKKIIFYTDCGQLNYNLINFQRLANADLILIESNYLETNKATTYKEVVQESVVGHSSRMQSLHFLQTLQSLTLQNNPQIVFIHTSESWYPYPHINDKIYDTLGWKHSRAHTREFYEVENI